MNNLIAFFNGKKTYIVAALTGAAAVADALGYHVPEYIYGFLATAFGISIRHAVATSGTPAV